VDGWAEGEGKGFEFARGEGKTRGGVRF